MPARRRPYLLAALLVPLACTAHAEPQSPDCAALQAWGAEADPRDSIPLAPRLHIPRALSDERLVPLFGQALTDWTQDEALQARGLVLNCLKAARAAKDTEAVQALGQANKLVAGPLRATARSISRARDKIESGRQAIAALPDSAELYRALGLLVEAESHEATDYGALSRFDGEISRPLRGLYLALREYPDSERDVLYTGLAQRRAAIREGLLQAAAERIAQAPADAAGLLAVRRAGWETWRDFGAAADAVHQAATQRAAEIEAVLAGASGAWRPPSCTTLYEWSGAEGAHGYHNLGVHSYRRAYDDERLVPVFGRPLAQWTDEEIELYAELAELCEARWRALAEDPRQIDRADDEAPALLRLARNGSWASHPGTVTHELPKARETLQHHAEVTERLDRLRAELGELPDGEAGLARITALRRDPILGQLAPQQRQAFERDLQAAEGRITARLGQAIIGELDRITVEQPADLGKLWRFREQAGLQRLDRATRVLVEARIDKTLRERAAAVQPAFQAALDALPVSPDGVQRALQAPAGLTGLPSPGVAPTAYRQAASERARVIAAELKARRCRSLWERLDLDEDAAAQALWLGREASTLGEFICTLEAAGHRIDEYAGAGLFSSTHSLKLTRRDQTFETLSLHTAEVAADQEMLIGYAVADANRERELSVADWGDYVAQLTDDPGTPDCARLMDRAPEELSINQRMQAMGCILQQGIQQMEQMR